MNYRHAFHAGNFADVHKHAVLARVLIHLADKPAAFRVVDTHAGAGLYDLAGPEASRTGEWRDGIGRLLSATLPPGIRMLLAPYLHAVALDNPGQQVPAAYPGSPRLALALMRPQDRLIACESEPTAAGQLALALARDRRARAIAIDGWTALSAYVPPKERRGLVLIDPPFEQADDFERLTHNLVMAHRKWPTGIYVAWYPIKARRQPDALAASLARSGIPKILRTELLVAPLNHTGRLNGSGLIVINPPWKLHEELRLLMPALGGIFGLEGSGASQVDWLAGER